MFPAVLLTNQRGHLFPWVPVALGVGIGIYFALDREPRLAVLAGLAALTLAAGLAALRCGPGLAPLAWALALVAAGLCLAAQRTAWVAGPVLDFRYYGPVQGRILDIDRSASDAVRLTLDRVVLYRMAPEDTPRRIRISLHGVQDWLDPAPGLVVVATAHLSGPSGAVEPGGFDFRRHAWFLRLGAIGYTRNPVLPLAESGARMPVATTRTRLAAHVRAALPGETGAFAAAVTTGDRSGMSQATLDTLRASNLAHLLAISGLHMGLLAGFVFASFRFLMALWPRAALRWPVKKIAAVLALLAASSYLALSGGNVATQRAFVMVAVMLGAVLADRRALSLRAVALAAIVVLVLRPDSLTGPGFQMSFAATVALVSVFGALRDRGHVRPGGRAWPVLAVVLSSAIAGLATAPYGAAHFNQVSRYGLLANLLAVPVMGTVVMPSAVVAGVLAPLGLEALPLGVMGLGLDWILRVAGGVAALDGAVGRVPAPPGAVLPILSAGALVVLLWKGPGRWAGLLPLACAGWLWLTAERPAMLVSGDGGLVGVMTAEGRGLSRARGGGFVAGAWLENDGDGSDQATAAARWPGDVPVRHVTGKVRSAAITGCEGAAVVVSNARVPPLEGCLVLDRDSLRRSGAVALDGAGRITAIAGAARRPWTGSRDGTLSGLVADWRAGQRARARPHLPELRPVVIAGPEQSGTHP